MDEVLANSDDVRAAAIIDACARRSTGLAIRPGPARSLRTRSSSRRTGIGRCLR
jgi:hypothetical protein